VLTSSEQFSAVTVTELNPFHGDEEGQTLRQFAGMLADCLA
jgi:hypothetical protein